jgi:hypothetical protein
VGNVDVKYARPRCGSKFAVGNTSAGTILKEFMGGIKSYISPVSLYIVLGVRTSNMNGD